MDIGGRFLASNAPGRVAAIVAAACEVAAYEVAACEAAACGIVVAVAAVAAVGNTFALATIASMLIPVKSI